MNGLGATTAVTTPGIPCSTQEILLVAGLLGALIFLPGWWKLAIVPAYFLSGTVIPTTDTCFTFSL